jgi:hypothetical protein
MREKMRVTTRSTAGVRDNTPVRCRALTTGLSKNVRRVASATGISTDLAQYRQAMIRVKVARIYKTGGLRARVVTATALDDLSSG